MKVNFIVLIIVAVLLLFNLIDANVNEDVSASVIYQSKSQLGEGAYWSTSDRVLYWLDIDGKKLNIFNPKSLKNEEISLPSIPGTVVQKTNGELVIALRSGISIYNQYSKNLKVISHPEKVVTNRYNDGKCDANGRFWVGSMSLENGTPAKATLYTIDSRLKVQEKLQNVKISNGIIWSLDNRAMYYIDTLTMGVDRFDFDLDSGEISNRKRVITFSGQDGLPDGMTIDSEGYLWVCHYDGGKVTRWNPDNGNKLMTVWVPGVKKVTSVAFGGDDLSDLFITTGRDGNSPDSGSLFHYKFTNGIHGVPSNKFSG
ncbi:senescence marker protein-30 family protein [Tieghemostelium lacteum]|uniref:Senescence marker protein-30 family protein n=1 Tax=Tieghemostelium lacteum TaxID=361077 RepID=A0A151Z5K3_TIELA|nr:senescence marker protein-30 family protein [Tieghemostelium lacteum]|eukprot:KYQ89243.1 senescence marker protein-30 family protein [Tieghemostelium lacteum]